MKPVIAAINFKDASIYHDTKPCRAVNRGVIIHEWRPPLGAGMASSDHVWVRLEHEQQFPVRSPEGAMSLATTDLLRVAVLENFIAVSVRPSSWCVLDIKAKDHVVSPSEWADNGHDIIESHVLKHSYTNASVLRLIGIELADCLPPTVRDIIAQIEAVIA